MVSFDLSQQGLPELTARLARLEPGQRIAIQMAGKTVAVLVTPDDAELLEALEDQSDNEAAERNLAESDERIPYEQVREELGL